MGRSGKRKKRTRERDGGDNGDNADFAASKSKRSCSKEQVDRYYQDGSSNSVAPTAISTSHQHNRHAFETTALDHCETPYCAYEHIAPVLTAIAKHLNIHPASNLRIWDPYYCDGTVKQHLTTLGYPNVINDNVDFYKCIQKSNNKEGSSIPPHDVLVTNPPYSGDHIERLLQFVCSSRNNNKPFCLLMPNWVARKTDYKDIINFGKSESSSGKSIKSNDNNDTTAADVKNGLFYLSPLEPYTYTMPTWNREDDHRPTHVSQETGHTTPYLSSWYICLKDDVMTCSLEKQMDVIAKRQKPQPAFVVAKTIKGLKWKIQKASANNNSKSKSKSKKKR